jgi:galactokinase
MAFRESVQFSLAEVRREDRSWANYPKGVIQELDRSGVRLRAARMLIGSSLPQGAGVSSSAALELATAEACYAMFGSKPAKPMDEAILCQRAERSFVGVPCGLLDQFSSLFGKKDHVLFLDCSTLRYSQVPVGRDDIRVVLADSGEKHALVDGQYARLRESCERARECAGAGPACGGPQPAGRTRRVTSSVHAAEVDPEDLPRATHVVRENERVLRGLAAFKSRHYPEIRKTHARIPCIEPRPFRQLDGKRSTFWWTPPRSCRVSSEESSRRRFSAARP